MYVYLEFVTKIFPPGIIKVLIYLIYIDIHIYKERIIQDILYDQTPMFDYSQLFVLSF